MTHISRCGPSRNSIPPIVSIYSGTTCLGHALNRGKFGWELFDAEDQSLGTFKTMKEAAAALPEEQL
jgi:hypothetical protein